MGPPKFYTRKSLTLNSFQHCCLMRMRIKHNKQSVPDCERVISPGVISFTERNNHPEEATVLKTIHNWHKAVDGRGLSEATRSDYCEAMLNWILEAWIPYLKTEQPDYSFIDVNK